MPLFGEIPSDTEVTQGGGGAVTGSWEFKDETAKADPGSGNFRLNAATYGSVTEIYISDTTKPGTDLTNLLNALTNGDQVYIQNGEDASEFCVWTITSSTDEGSYFTLVVTAVANGSLLTDGKECIVSFSF